MAIAYTRENPAPAESHETTLARASQVLRSTPGLTREQIAARLNMDPSGAQNVLNDLSFQRRARSEVRGQDLVYFAYSPEEQKRVFDSWNAKVAAAEDIVSRESWYQSAGEPVLMKARIAELLKRQRTMTLRNAAAYLSQDKRYILDLALELRPAVDVRQLDQFGEDYQLTLMSDPGFKARPSQSEFQQAKAFLSDIEYKRILSPEEKGY